MKKSLIALCIIVLLFNVALAAAEETVYTEGFFYYTVFDKSITIVGYFGSESTVTVPSSIAGIPVNAVGPNAFAGTSVQLLYLPDTVRELGDNATGDADVRFIGQNTYVPYQETATPGQQGPDATPASENTAVPSPTDYEEPTARPTQETNTPTPAPASETPGRTPEATIQNETTVNPTDTVQETEAATVTPAPETDEPEPTTLDPGERHKGSDLTWLWLTISVAIIAAVGLTALIISLKRKR